MYCITILVARAFAELRSSYSNINGSHVYHRFELNCPPYTQQYSSPKLGRSTNLINHEKIIDFHRYPIYSLPNPIYKHLICFLENIVY